MKDFLISEKYRLEIRWKSVNYLDDGSVDLIGCYFTGPVLNNTEKLNDEDHMSLDFGTQYITFVGNYFIADFKWKGVRYIEDKNQISFYVASISSNYPDNIPTLKNNDFLVIDTVDHDVVNMLTVSEKENRRKIKTTTTMTTPLSYKTYLLREDGQLYNFKGK